MITKNRGMLLGILLTIIFLTTSVMPAPIHASEEPAQPQNKPLSREQLAYVLGVQAYIYGYPLVVMQATKAGSLQLAAPINQFYYTENLATPDFRGVVSPNTDTLYFAAWLNLSKAPVTLHVPSDPTNRYYTVQMLDLYTNTFQNVSVRSTQQQKNDYVIVGPTWKGSLPATASTIKAPTNTVWLIGRVGVNGPDDLADAIRLEKQFTLESPSEAAPQKPQVSLSSTLYQDILQSPLAFFTVMTEAMKKNPPPQADSVLLDQFAPIGIVPGKGLDLKKWDAPTIAGLKRAMKDAPSIIADSGSLFGETSNGWARDLSIGTYGDRFLQRAYIAYSLLGANVPSEEIYARTFVDESNVQLNGVNRYVLHFDAKQLPKVDAFWSVTLYGDDFFLVPNSIGRYSLGSLTKGLRYNDDGSLDFYIQQTPPKGNESNWLPAPKGTFNLMLRMFEPKPDMLEGRYQIPPVRKLDSE
ncbi:UNVERIFIED_CONTAM: hypothetical protein ABID98_003829 [Brevibacillus sp. OAP136]